MFENTLIVWAGHFVLTPEKSHSIETVNISGERVRESAVEREMKILVPTPHPIRGNALSICPDMQHS